MYFIFNVTCTLNEWKSTLFVSVHALGLFFLHSDLVLPAEALRCSYRRCEPPVGSLLRPGRCPAPYQPVIHQRHKDGDVKPTDVTETSR